MLKLYNTLSRSIEEFKPLGKTVGLYTCGPTVYNYAHIGNLRTYVFEDILRRVLAYNQYDITHVMNITDVGHLTDDADNGEDKMEKGAAREGKTACDLARFYTDAFFHDTGALNILIPTIVCKATEHIQEQIMQVQILIDKELTYETSDGIYFDTAKISDYGKLAELEKQKLKAGVRVDMGEKKNPHDFALWKFSGQVEKRQMEWSAFGRMGFPGWHIECSAMSVKYLGEQFDIHCGGVDHIPVHHTNEIAQAENVTGKKPWVNFWVHGEHLIMGEEKMAKSGGNFITLQSIIDRGIHPLSYRYFLLQAHYRKQLQFNGDALAAAHAGLKNLKREISHDTFTAKPPEIEKIKNDFRDAINDDLNTSRGLAILWSAVKEKNIDAQTIAEFDTVLGLDLLKEEKKEPAIIPSGVQKLIDDRAIARKAKDWVTSDRLRDEIQKRGFTVEDK